MFRFHVGSDDFDEDDGDRDEALDDDVDEGTTESEVSEEELRGPMMWTWRRRIDVAVDAGTCCRGLCCDVFADYEKWRFCYHRFLFDFC